MKRSVTVILTCTSFAAISLASLRPWADTVSAQGRGMYTEAQRKRGEALYTSSCASCHGANLAGRVSFSNGVPALAGEDFLDMWLGQSVGELFERGRSTPPDEHGKVMPQETADVLAYVLSKSDFPAGQTDLAADASALNKVMLDNTIRVRAPVAASSVPTRSVLEGVFSSAQSQRGAKVYNSQCATCHADSLAGKDVIPPLVGPEFIDHWVSLSAQDLFQKMKSTMPQDSPDSLTEAEYVELLAYIFEKNKFPATGKDMEPSTEALKAIRIETKK